jgi:hypothetical protein
MNKSEQISEFLASPVKIGDTVTVRGLGIQNKDEFGRSTEVVKVLENGAVVVKQYNSELIINSDDYQRTTFHIGANPFTKANCLDKLTFKQYNIESLLFAIGFDCYRRCYKTVDPKFPVKSVNFNPFVIHNGKQFFFQRGFEWKLEQKQNLITSIYHQLDIGKFILRKHRWAVYERGVKEGKETFYRDVVDGKQRLSAIVEFISDGFKDEYGFYYSDLSDEAQRTFCNHSALAYGEIQESATDKDTIDIFLNLNIAGIRVDDEHIDYVKSIRDILNS